MNTRALGLVLWLVLIVYSGLVFTGLWAWFIVPFGLPAITLPWAIGLMSVSSLLGSSDFPDDKSDMLTLFLKNGYTITLALVVGFLASLFMPTR